MDDFCGRTPAGLLCAAIGRLGAAMGQRRGHVARILRFARGWLHRLAAALRTESDQAGSELVGLCDRGVGRRADAARHARGSGIHRTNGVSGIADRRRSVSGRRSRAEDSGIPLLLLLFLFPIPAIVYARLTLPLQIFASSAAETALNWIGIPVLRDGNILELPHERLSVVEACSGIRSLLSMSFPSLIYAYFFDQRIAMRWVLLLATVPIAIAANAARVTLMGVLSEYRGDLAQGAFHLFEGWVLFVVALGLLIALHQILRRRQHAAV
jgi:exosortase/archaeosortase family protein